MDLSYSDEQNMLKDQAERFVAENCNMDARRKLGDTEIGFNLDNWKQMAELGWMGLPFSEEDGGFGGTPVETMIIMEAIGSGPAVEPYLSTVVLGGGILKRAASAEQKAALIPAIASGEMLLAVAYAEPQARFDLFDVNTLARKEGDNFVLNGHKAVVINGGSADKLIVSARTSGDRRDRKGVTLFLVDSDAKGLDRRSYRTVDGGRAAEVTFENVSVPAANVIGPIDGGVDILDDVLDEAIAAVAAESVGAMKILLDTTVEYTKTRVQFGQPIGQFQSLRHRMADMFMEYEQTKSLAMVATLRLMDNDATERKKASSAAKVQTCKGGRFVGQQAVQLHGGMGMTDELNVGHYFKRLTMIDILFGDEDYHLKRFAAL